MAKAKIQAKKDAIREMGPFVTRNDCGCPARSGWHTIKIVTVGRDIRGYSDGQLLTEADDDQSRDTGRVGLWTKSDTVTEFDDLTMQSALPEMIEDFK